MPRSQPHWRVKQHDLREALSAYERMMPESDRQAKLVSRGSNTLLTRDI
jgi:hypothetical protein